MLQDIKNTIKQSAIYGLSRISSKLISFILLPLYSLHFSISDYGVIVRIETLWQILFAIFLFGLESGIIRWYNIIEKPESKKRFLFTITLFITLSNLLYIIIFILFSKYFSLLIFGTDIYSTTVLYASLIAFAESMVFVVFLLLRINNKAFLYSFYAILISLISLGLQYYFISYTNNQLNGVFLAKIIAPLCIFIILIPYFLKNIQLGIEKHYLVDIIKYSFPIMLATLVGTLLNQSDRYILGFLTNSKEVGIYGLGYNICGLINILIISPFTLTFSVISWDKLKDKNAKRFFTKSVTYLFFITIYAAIFISLFTPHFIKILTLNSDYWLAKNIVPWIALSIPFYGMQTISIFSFYVTKNTKYILYFYLIALCINIILNLLLIPYFKMYGAAISNFISFFLLSLLFYIYSKKEYFFEYEWYKIFLTILFSIIIMFPFFYFNIEQRILQISLKILALISFPFLLLPFKFYESIEIERIKGFINKYFYKKR